LKLEYNYIPRIDSIMFLLYYPLKQGLKLVITYSRY